MRSLQIEIPKEILLSLKIPGKSVKQQLTEGLSVYLYQQGFLSFGKARQLANLSKWQFAEKLGSKKIPRHYTSEDLEEDMQFAYDVFNHNKGE